MTKFYPPFHADYVDRLSNLLADKGVIKQIGAFIKLIEKSHENRKTIYLCGNGGHASTCNHFATDLSTLGIRAISLTANPSEVTRLGNDFGYERIFDKQLENGLNEGDIVAGISASGNSMNIVKAFELANRRRAHSIAMVGFEDGGKAKKVAKHNIHIKTPVGMYGLVEDAHMTICHIIVFYLKEHGKNKYALWLSNS